MAVDQKAYRRYHAGVERALTLFDPNADWADYIAFLSRLLKALETGKPEGLTEVPCKARIALSLSRCLHPALPAGVHQKALDVYHEIFSTIGAKCLAKDLHLYLPGLSNTLAFANLSTRPMVLDLFEEHVLKLPPLSLRPALKGLLLSLLPVIEEETSEDFERCLHSFDTIRACFAQVDLESFFWQTLFVASISNPNRRTGVLVYLSRYLPKLPTTHERAEDSAETSSRSSVITKPEPGLLVRCFATGLRDEQPLIQRGFLDLLVTHLPLNSSILQTETYRKDLDVLVLAAIMVVLRRDMSLNRRLWSWFLNADSKASDTQIASPMEADTLQHQLTNDYFVQNGFDSMVRGIQTTLSHDIASSGTPRTLSFRILSSLMDRWEIGGPVVRASFSTMMGELMAYQSSAPTQSAFDEVFRSANVCFDGIESTTLFECFSELLSQHQVELITFIVANFNVEQVDMVGIHAMKLSTTVARKISDNDSQAAAMIGLLSDLTAIIPPESSTTMQPSQAGVATELLRVICQSLCELLSKPGHRTLLPMLCTSFERVLVLSHSSLPLTKTGLVEKMQLVVGVHEQDGWSKFVIVDVCSRILTGLLQRLATFEHTIQGRLLDFVPELVESLWSYLDPSTPQYHLTAVEHMWRFCDLTGDQDIVESAIMRLLVDGHRTQATLADMHVQRFGTLFHHTKTVKRSADDVTPQMLRRPSLYILDQMTGSDRSEPSVQWLLSLSNISPVLTTVLDSTTQQLQDIALTLARIQKLTHVLYLSEDHWQSFSASPDMQTMYKFCLKLVDYSHPDGTCFTSEAYALLRSLYGGRSRNTPPEELISLLVDKLDTSMASLDQQEQVLDTLLAVLNDKSLIPSSLVSVLLQGLATTPSDERLDKWITLLCNFLPNHAAFLPSLLKVTGTFCKRIEQTFDDLQSLFSHKLSFAKAKSPERSIANLLSGLEYVLARAHQQVFLQVPAASQLTNGVMPEPVSGRAKANDKLTVILCMQDAVRICARLWSWKSAARTSTAEVIKSFQYTAMKVRSRSRKIMENLIEAEPQECSETLIGMWLNSEQVSVLDLLQTLNGARPRSMMPAVFNAIYNRTNSGALNASQKSSLSIQLDSIGLISFLNEYTIALEDDMLEEIWTDCATFLREVLGNPMPHRRILIRLLRFCSTLSIKMENTNFSEESRMYRELADICARLFTAIFTIKPTGFDGSASLNDSPGKAASGNTNKTGTYHDENMLIMLLETLPHLGPLLSQYDRANAVYAGISTNITGPVLHARAFPTNLTVQHLEIMRLMSNSLKTWKKDVLDSFYNPKFFQSSTELATSGWLPLVKQLQASDKAIVSETLNRIMPPAAAGIMLGIGAAAARTEADKKTQLELRRVSTMILSSELDVGLPHLSLILQKIEELLGATPESSPSQSTRADVYLLIRALLLRFTHTNLSPIWPILDAELQDFCKDLLAGRDSRYTTSSKLQGAKLLDLLLLMRPDEFQLHEWLFVTDTIDAIYPSSDVAPRSYADEIAAALNAGGTHFEAQNPGPTNARRPWLHGKDASREQNVDVLLAGFFGQLSIRAFEDLYSLQPLDEKACQEDVLADVFTDVAT